MKVRSGKQKRIPEKILKAKTRKNLSEISQPQVLQQPPTTSHKPIPNNQTQFDDLYR